MDEHGGLWYDNVGILGLKPSPFDLLEVCVRARARAVVVSVAVVVQQCSCTM